MENRYSTFVWETHGIHAGTGNDHVKHGVDELDEIIEQAIDRGYPNISFIIHTPRLTRFRYESESDTDIKFIRGDLAYMEYASRMKLLRSMYGHRISIKYGIELEWLGSGLGLQWNRSKIYQAMGSDYIIGSLHFSPEGIPYDGSAEEAQRLLELRGGLENYWAGYIEEMIEMVDSSHSMIQVVGHIDLPKIHMPIPEPLLQLENSSHPLARRMRVLLEMISEYNLVLDVNLAGIKKGCGIYPELPILKYARSLDIAISLGTDTHALHHLGVNYADGINYAEEAGYHQYVSFSHCIPEKRPLRYEESEMHKYALLNLGIEFLNRRFHKSKRAEIPHFSFGGSYRTLLHNYAHATTLGDCEQLRIRRGERAVTLTHEVPKNFATQGRGLYSVHKDEPGVLSILFNTLASEEINVETAYLNGLHDGTASAFLTLTGPEERIAEAVAFVRGTAGDWFFDISWGSDIPLPKPKVHPLYVLDIDGVEMPIPLSSEMIITIHDNSAGVLLILLSALSSKGINVMDMQLAKRGAKGYAILGIESSGKDVAKLLSHLGPAYSEASYIKLHGDVKGLK